MEPNELVKIIDNMNDSDRYSGEEHLMSDTEVTVCDDDTYRNCLDVYI